MENQKNKATSPLHDYEDYPMDKDTAVTLLFAIIGAASVLTPFFIVDSKNRNDLKGLKNELSSQLASDAEVKEYEFDFFEATELSNEYFFYFTGNAIKLDGHPIDFIKSKYKVDESSYYKVKKMLDSKTMHETLNSQSILTMILDVVKESKIVESDQIERTNLSSDSKRIIKDITKPSIGEDFIYYDVTLIDIEDGKNTADLGKNQTCLL
ncbi:TPA: hypothetical protein GXZ34_03435 [bacterium]|nr:hypothetical protein [bacterium]